MSRLVWTALAIGCLFSQSILHAAPITVTGDRPQQRITITIENATIDTVLGDLSKKYGFEVAGLENVEKGETLSGSMSGSLPGILERLLRNWNHMIVRSRDSESGVAKVMILNSVYGAGASPKRVGGDRSDKQQAAAVDPETGAPAQ
jgi:hypothetical protein